MHSEIFLTIISIAFFRYAVCEVFPFPGCHTGITAEDMMAYEVINEERVLRGKDELDVNAELQAVAFYQAQDMDQNIKLRSCPTKYMWSNNYPKGVSWTPCKCNVDDRPQENDCFTEKLSEIFPNSNFGPVFISIGKGNTDIENRDEIRGIIDANQQYFQPVLEGGSYKTSKMTQFGAVVRGKILVVVAGASGSHEPCNPKGRSLVVNDADCETYCGEYQDQYFH